LARCSVPLDGSHEKTESNAMPELRPLAVVDAEIETVHCRLLSTLDEQERRALLDRLDYITLERSYAAIAAAGQRKDARRTEQPERQGQDSDAQNDSGSPGDKPKDDLVDRGPGPHVRERRREREHEDND